jgi:hypothetical protein
MFTPQVPVQPPDTVALTTAPARPIALDANDALVLSVVM